MENLDSIVTAASRILDNDAQDNISESIRQINLTMTNIEKISANLNDVITGQKKNLASTISNLSEVTGNLKSNSGKLEHVMDNISMFSDSLAKLELNQTINHLNSSVSSLNTILNKIDSANGSLGLLVNDPKLYQNLNYTSENLNRLLIDFRLNPKRYVHFSAVDLGRKINISTPSDSQLSDSITFRVQLFSSATPISLTSPIFKGLEEVYETKSGSNYCYSTGPENSYNKVIMILNKVQGAFPEAFLKCYKNGKEISLKKVLKTSKN